MIRNVFVAGAVFGALHPHSMQGAGDPQQATMSVDVTGVPITGLGEPDADHDPLNDDPPVATSTSAATSRTRPLTKPGECRTW